MQKSYFHNNKSFDLTKDKKIQSQNIKKNRVDINILLNRVRVEESNQLKRKIIFFSLTSLALCLFGFFITIIK